MKALKVTISGDYRKSKRDIVDFEEVTGVIPACDHDVAYLHIRSRYVPMWIGRSEKYKDRLQSVRAVHLDELKETAAEFSFVGKDIKEMSHEELQDLATAYDLRRVPLYKKSGLRETRTIAYVEYHNAVAKVGAPLDMRSSDFDYNSLPSLKATEGSRRDLTRKKTNDEVITAEMAGDNSEQVISLDELKKIAEQKGIQHHPNIGYDKLYAKIFQQA